MSDEAQLLADEWRIHATWLCWEESTWRVVLATFKATFRSKRYHPRTRTWGLDAQGRKVITSPRAREYLTTILVHYTERYAAQYGVTPTVTPIGKAHLWAELLPADGTR